MRFCKLFQRSILACLVLSVFGLIAASLNAYGAPPAKGASTAADAPVPKDTPQTTPKISFSSTPLTLSKSVSVKGNKGDFVTIYKLDPQEPAANSQKADSTKLCAANDLKNNPIALASEVVLTTDPQDVPLNVALSTGDALCIADTLKTSSDPIYSYIAIVKNPGALGPTISQKLSSDSKSVVVTGKPKAEVRVYQFDLTQNVTACKAAIETGKGNLLQIAAASGKSVPTDVADLVDTKPYTITLNTPPDAGSQICLKETLDATDGGGDLYSEQPKIVIDANNPYPRIRTFYTAGFMINNQNGSNSNTGSSTGSEYLDVGLTLTPVLERGTGHFPVGLNASLSGRFSALSVAAPATTNTPSNNGSSNNGNPDNGTLNILSSQESFRMLGALSAPIRQGVFKCTGNCFFLGPIVKAGLDTLLNPSATATSGTDGSATTATATFAPVYTEYSGGLRMGLRQYPTSKDPDADLTPRTITQVDITFGRYSYLQSLVDQSRKTLGRIEVNGFLRLAGSPFVLGLDANLPQSEFAPKHPGLLDNPGGNVAVYFGVSGSLSSLFKGIKFPSSN